MKLNQLGNSDLFISEVSFGCMSLEKDRADNGRLLRKAFENGINFFDTADLYDKGENEIIVGKALKEVRNKVIISTKVGNEWREDGSGWDWNPRKNYILSAIEGSLKRLQTDYIDLYQLHGGTIEDPIDETIEAFELLKQQGKIRHYGISSIRPNVIREYVSKSKIVSVMMQYSLLDRRPEEESINLLRSNKISVLARGSLAKGLLIDKDPTPYLKYSSKQVDQARKAIEAVSGQTRTAASTAVKYVLQETAVASAVLGIRTETQLIDAIAIGASEPITDQEIKQLRSSVEEFCYEQHR